MSSAQEDSQNGSSYELSDFSRSSQQVAGQPNNGLRAVDEKERQRARLPELNFKPVALDRWFLSVVIIFYIVCCVCLTLLIFYDYLESTSISGWFTIRILPAIVGTISTSCYRSIILNLAHITPYAKCAKKKLAKKEMAPINFMGSYFPFLSYRTTIRSGEPILIVGVILWFISGFIIPFKSSILNTSDYYNSGWITWVAVEYLYPLLAIYGVLIIYLFVLLLYTWKLKTGLRWDPVSIADSLALFRHSDFLEDFKDLDMDDPASHRERFTDSAYRLGYWRIDKNGPPQYWHGFARDSGVPNRSRPRTVEGPSAGIIIMIYVLIGWIANRNCVDRYSNTTSFVFHPVSMGIWITLWVILSGCFSVLLVKGFQHYHTGFVLPCSTLLAGFILQLLPPFLASFFTLFWEEADLYYRTVQPYAGMRKEGKAQMAHENLLLEYPFLPSPVISYIAFRKKHYKVSFISLMALVQRLLPIIAAGSVTLFSSPDQDDATIVYVSPILCTATLVFILLEFPLIVLVIPDPERQLPHLFGTFGDLLSWCWDSDLVRDKVFDMTIQKGDDNSEVGLDDRRVMKAKLLSDRDKYAFGEIRNRNNRANGNHHEGPAHVGFDFAKNIDIPEIPKRRRCAI